jgi:hypothetical protein
MSRRVKNAVKPLSGSRARFSRWVRTDGGRSGRVDRNDGRDLSRGSSLVKYVDRSVSSDEM